MGASESLDDVPQDPRLPCSPPLGPTDRLPYLYGSLSALLGISGLAGAVEGLEKHPGSQGRKQTLDEEIAAAKAHEDPELVDLAQALLEQIKSQPGGAQHIQNAVGNTIAQADRGATATVTVTHKD